MLNEILEKEGYLILDNTFQIETEVNGDNIFLSDGNLSININELNETYCVNINFRKYYNSEYFKKEFVLEELTKDIIKKEWIINTLMYQFGINLYSIFKDEFSIFRGDGFHKISKMDYINPDIIFHSRGYYYESERTKLGLECSCTDNDMEFKLYDIKNGIVKLILNKDSLLQLESILKQKQLSLNRDSPYMNVFYEKAKHFYGEDKVFKRNSNVGIYYPEILIKNSANKKHLIKDLWVIFDYNFDFYVTRTQYTFEEWKVDYLHSHVNGISHNFNSTCKGSGDFGTFFNEIKYKANYKQEIIDSDIEGFLYLFNNYIHWESLSGVPYRKMSLLEKAHNSFQRSVQSLNLSECISKITYEILEKIPFTINNCGDIVVDFDKTKEDDINFFVDLFTELLPNDYTNQSKFNILNMESQIENFNRHIENSSLLFSTNIINLFDNKLPLKLKGDTEKIDKKLKEVKESNLNIGKRIFPESDIDTLITILNSKINGNRKKTYFDKICSELK